MQISERRLVALILHELEAFLKFMSGYPNLHFLLQQFEFCINLSTPFCNPRQRRHLQVNPPGEC